MRSFTLTTTAALAATATASSVTLKAKPCSSAASTTASNLLTVSLDTASPVPQDLSQICGLSVLSASASVSLDTITCRIYSDAAPLSDMLSLGQDISLAGVDIKKASLLCKTTPLADIHAAVHAGGVLARAESKNTTSTHLMVASGSPPAITTAHISLQTAGASAGVSGSAGLGSSHHGKNGTSLSGTATPTPTSNEAQASETGDGESAGVKVGAGWGVGVLAAGVVVVLL